MNSIILAILSVCCIQQTTGYSIYGQQSFQNNNRLRLLSNSNGVDNQQQQSQFASVPKSSFPGLISKDVLSPSSSYSTYNNQQQQQQRPSGINKNVNQLTEQQIQDQKINDQIQQVLDNSINFNLDQTSKKVPIPQSFFDQKKIPISGFKFDSNNVLLTTTTTTTTTPAPIPLKSGLFRNPCTAEVLRMSEIMLFKDPTDKTCYLICTDVNVYHSMPCPEGTVFNENMHHCVPEGYEAPKCPDSLCKHDADCLVDESNQFKCICKVGFTGQFCEVNIDECALEGNTACGSEGSCVDQINGYYCVFKNGLIGLRRESAIANPCTSVNLAKESYFFEIPSINGDVWLQCVSESLFVTSKCAEHLFWNSELETCTMERPLPKSGVCVTLPCRNGGECQDLGNNNFQCLCRAGFSGHQCETTVDLCESNPCANSGRCLSWTGGFTCVCQNNIVDETCTSGLNNPCPSSTSLIPGFNDYFPHIIPEKFFQCDKDGRAFARSCPTDLKWKQEVLSCVSSSVPAVLTTAPTTTTARLPIRLLFDQPELTSNNLQQDETDPALNYDLNYDLDIQPTTTSLPAAARQNINRSFQSVNSNDYFLPQSPSNSFSSVTRSPMGGVSSDIFQQQRQQAFPQSGPIRSKSF